MVIFCMRRSILLNWIMKRSSSVRFSRGLRSFSYCRRTFSSDSVGMNLIKHSTKSTGNVRRSNLTHTNIKALSSSIWLPPETAGVGPVRSPPYNFMVNHDNELIKRWSFLVYVGCELHLNCSADLLWCLAHFSEGDGQVFSPVGVQQQDFIWSFLRGLLFGGGDVYGWTLCFRLKHLLKLIQSGIQILNRKNTVTIDH